MKIKKQIITTKDIELEIKGITLLDIDEYESCKDIAPLSAVWWWLRAPGSISYYAAYVIDFGYVDYYGDNVSCVGGVRPALIYNPTEIVKVGDKVEVAGYLWTIISDNMMLCDDIIGKSAFEKDWRADDANDYEKSDIKKWIEKWYEENIENDDQ